MRSIPPPVASTQEAVGVVTDRPGAAYYTKQEAMVRLGNPSEASFSAWLKARDARGYRVKTGVYGYDKNLIDAIATSHKPRHKEQVGVHPDPELFAQLYQSEWLKLVYQMAKHFNFSLETAEDIVSQTFLDLWRLRPDFFERYPKEGLQRHILFREVRQQAWDWGRREQTVERRMGAKVRLLKEEYEHIIPAPEPSVEQQVIDREHWAEVLAKLRPFPPVTQLIMKLTALGYSYREITAELKDRVQEIWTERQIKEVVTATRAKLLAS